MLDLLLKFFSNCKHSRRIALPKGIFIFIFVASTFASGYAIYGLLFYFREIGGPNLITFRLSVDSPGYAQLFYDRGEGISEKDSVAVYVQPALLREVSFRVPRTPLVSIRFDPPPHSGKVSLTPPRLISPAGHLVAEFPLTSVVPLSQVADFKQNAIEQITTARCDSEDPQLNFGLGTPLRIGSPKFPVLPVGLFLLWFSFLYLASTYCVSRAPSEPDVRGTLSRVLHFVVGDSKSALFLGATVVALIQFWMLWPLHDVIDWPLWDEINYAAYGRHWATVGGSLGALHSSPLYMLSYGALSFVPSVEHAIIFQHYTIKLLIPILLYFLLARWFRSPVLAVCIALFIGASQFNLEFPLLVYQFAFVWFLLALVVIDTFPLAGFGVLLLATLSRQEYQFSLIAVSLLVICQVAKGHRKLGTLLRIAGGRSAAILFATTAFLLAAFVVAHTQLGSTGGRAWFAFQQHFAVRGVEAGEFSGINPWLDYTTITNKVFPGANSIYSAFKLNPAAFFHHIGYNVKQVPNQLLELARGHDNIRHFVMLFGVLSVFCACLGERPILKKSLLSITTALCAIFSVLPGILIFSKAAYLLPIVPAALGIVYGLLLCVSCCSQQLRLIFRFAIFIAIAISFFAWTSTSKPFERDSRPRLVKATVELLREIWPQEGAQKLLGASASSYAHYDGDLHCIGIEPLSETFGKNSPNLGFQALLEKYDPYAVIITQDWKSSAQFQTSEANRLMSSPGWKQINLPVGELYIRKTNPY